MTKLNLTTANHSHSSTLTLAKLKRLLPSRVAKQLLSAKLFYQGIHNATYVCN